MEIPRHWRLKNQRYKLEGVACKNCNQKIFPPRQICPHCGSDELETFMFSGKGDVFSFTTIYETPAGFEDNAPYTVALVKLEEGPMVTTQLTDLGDAKPEIGLEVEMVVRRLRQDGDDRGMVIYGYKFRPVFSGKE